MIIMGRRSKRVPEIQSVDRQQNQWVWPGRSLLFFAVLLLLADLPVRSQQSAPIILDVNAVSLLATVRDKKGDIIRNLTKDDFALDQERAASRTFLDQVLRVDKDKAFVIQFDREVTLLQDLTSSREKLQAAIEHIDTPQFSQSGSSGGGGGSSGGSSGGSAGGSGGRGSHGWGGGGTLLYDAVFLASDELMKKQHGRKALIVLTDGVDHGSKENLQEAIATAQRADTLVYCILFADKEAYGNGGGFGGPHMGGGMGGRHGGYPRPTEESRPDGKKVLKQMSEATGGRFFEVTKKEPIDKIYDAIDEELRYQYSL